MEFTTPLCELAYKHGTDKCPQIRHSYTPLYYELFKDRRGSVKKVLELGVGFVGSMPWVKHYKVGASLYMWRDFFPNAQIYGADVVPETVFKDERIETFLCNEKEPGDLEKLIEKTGSDIDLFVDDGVHRAKWQIIVCKTLMPLLGKNVTYIIEDTNSVEYILENLKEYDCQVSNLAEKFNVEKIGNNLIIVKWKI